jgi:hypothetical protein
METARPGYSSAVILSSASGPCALHPAVAVYIATFRFRPSAGARRAHLGATKLPFGGRGKLDKGRVTTAPQSFPTKAKMDMDQRSR